MSKGLISKRKTEVELSFVGDGAIIRTSAGGLAGGVPDPSLSANSGFNLVALADSPAGAPMPAEPLHGSFQLNLWATAEDLRALGLYLLSLAELDTSADPDFHQHHDDLMSADGHTRLEVIVRKIGNPAG